jgi:hypothetical protein
MKIVKINVGDGLGEIEVALHSHTEASRLTAYLEEAAVSIAVTLALKEQEIDTEYQCWNHWGHWDNCTSESYRLNNEWGTKTRVLFTRAEAVKETK